MAKRVTVAQEWLKFGEGSYGLPESVAGECYHGAAQPDINGCHKRTCPLPRKGVTELRRGEPDPLTEEQSPGRPANQPWRILHGNRISQLKGVCSCHHHQAFLQTRTRLCGPHATTKSRFTFFSTVPLSLPPLSHAILQTSHLEVICILQKHYTNSTDSSHTSFTQLPLTFTSDRA